MKHQPWQIYEMHVVRPGQMGLPHSALYGVWGEFVRPNGHQRSVVLTVTEDKKGLQMGLETALLEYWRPYLQEAVDKERRSFEGNVMKEEQDEGKC